MFRGTLTRSFNLCNTNKKLLGLNYFGEINENTWSLLMLVTNQLPYRVVATT